MMGIIYIRRNWACDKACIHQMFSAIIEQQRPAWIISYLEGTRISPEKLQQSQQFALSKNMPSFEQVMIPRTRGFIATVNAFRNSHIKAIYDLTLCYTSPKGYQKAPSLLRIHSGSLEDHSFHIHIKRFSMDDVPLSEQDIRDWVMERFREKEIYLKERLKLWQESQ